jgi:ubiquinone/menaquinone biosynthesis C-methylase UbiE
MNHVAIARLRDHVAKDGLANIITKVGKAEERVLCDRCADIVFLGIVLHDFKNPAKVLLNARKMLKSNGRLVNLDWKKKPMRIGPPLYMRFGEEEAIRLIIQAGFKIESAEESGPYHYLILAKL